MTHNGGNTNRQEKESILRKSITLGELIGFAVTIAFAAVMNYSSNQVRFKALEVKLDLLEGNYAEIKNALIRIESSLRVELNSKRDK